MSTAINSRPPSTGSVLDAAADSLERFLRRNRRDENSPELPARPDPRRLALKGVLGLMLGGMVGVFWAFGREMMATSGESDPDDYAEFAHLKEAAAEDLRGLWRRVRKRVGLLGTAASSAWLAPRKRAVTDYEGGPQ